MHQQAEQPNLRSQTMEVWYSTAAQDFCRHLRQMLLPQRHIISRHLQEQAQIFVWTRATVQDQEQASPSPAPMPMDRLLTSPEQTISLQPPISCLTAVWQ